MARSRKSRRIWMPAMPDGAQALARAPQVADGAFLQHVTVLILTWNEAANIGRTLAALARFPRIVVLDSGSTDGTETIASTAANVRVVRRPFDTHAAQWNYGLAECGIVTPWVLALDADYALSRELVDEIAALAPAETIAGYKLSFRYCVYGRPLSGTLYPPVIALFRRERGNYIQAGHTQRLAITGTICNLEHPALHDDRKPLSRWLQSQQAYARLEAQYLMEARGPQRLSDRVRRMLIPAPFLVLFYTLLVKGCVRDGWRGWFYALQRVLAEILIALELLDLRLRRLTPHPPCL